MDAIMEKPVKRRGKMNLSDAERARRADRARPLAAKAAAASAARPPEERSRTASIGGKAYVTKYQALRDAMIPDSPESIQSRRKEHEATRERILSALIERAEDENADTAVVSLALRELRAEADRLRELEKVARAERAANGGRSPLVAAAPASPGIPTTDNSPAENPPVSGLAAD